MGGGERKVEEKRLSPATLLDVAHRAPGDLRHDRVQLPPRRHGADMAEHPLRLLLGGLSDESVLLEPGVGREVRDIDSEIIVKAVIHRTAPDRFAEVDAFFHRIDTLRSIASFEK